MRNNNESKAVLMIDYVSVVLDTSIAMQVFALLNANAAYKLDGNWVKDENGNSQQVYKVRAMNKDIKLSGVSPEDFAMWKLAGASDE